MVYVGVNNKAIDVNMNENSKFRKEHEIRVKKVYKRKEWIGNSDMQ